MSGAKLKETHVNHEGELAIVLAKNNEDGDDTMLNYQLSQKLKLIGRGKFNHLTITLTLPLTCGLKLSFNR